MEFEIRTIAEDELEAFRRCQSYAFGNEFNPEHLEGARKIFEFDRNLAALEGDLIVGTAGIFSFQMSVPGERSIPTAGVTMVSVRPTHRRRGVVTGVMRRQLEQVRERGESVAILWASESSIYGRFGYGMATQMEIVRVPRVWANLRNDLPTPSGTVRTLSVEEAKESLPALHERLRLGVPCAIGRAEKWWEIRIFRDLPEWRDGHTSNFYVVYEEDGVAQGFVRYRRKGDFQDWLAKGSVSVNEFHAATPEARIASGATSSAWTSLKPSPTSTAAWMTPCRSCSRIPGVFPATGSTASGSAWSMLRRR
jgi:predicted acetyltransferase